MSKLLLVLPLIALVLVFSPDTLADGVAYLVGEDLDYIGPLWQRQQRALLSHDGGIERLLIGIDIRLEEDNSGALWLFPVPGTLETVEIDLTDRFPVMRGMDPMEKARSRISESLATETALVLNPLLGAMLFLFPATHRAREGVIEHAAIEKYGLRTEAITADSLEALGTCLSEKGLKIPQEELALFEPYLNDKYVLIATRVLSKEELRASFPQEETWRLKGSRRRWPGVYVTFPAQKAFYPMRPTSGYGDDTMWVTIVTIGHVEPEGDAAMLRAAECKHYVQDAFSREAFPEGMLDGIEGGERLYYTRVTFNCRASMFTSDLTFEPRPGFSRSQLAVYSLTEVPLRLVRFLVFLYIAGGLCGLIYLGEWWRPATYGLLGIMSFPVVSHFIWHDLVTPGLSRSRVSAFTYALTYLCVFIVLNVTTHAILLLPLRY